MSGYDDDFFDEKENDEEEEETMDASEDNGQDDDSQDLKAKSSSKKKKPKSSDDLDEDGFDDFDDMEEVNEKRKLPPPIKENKFIRFTGKITPAGRDENNVINALKIQNIDDNKVYPVEMNEIGKQLSKRCFHELFVTGELVPQAGENNFVLVVKSFL